MRRHDNRGGSKQREIEVIYSEISIHHGKIPIHARIREKQCQQYQVHFKMATYLVGRTMGCLDGCLVGCLDG